VKGKLKRDYPPDFVKLLNNLGGRGNFDMSRRAGVKDDAEQRRREAKYYAHRAQLQAMGHDPNFIGTTEVKHVCCEGCGKPIAWKILRGWQD
jgi:hypothetical protein